MHINIRLVFISICFLFAACSSESKEEAAKDVKNENQNQKFDGLLKLLTVKLMDECASFPSFIASPYQEFPDVPATGGLYFDGPGKKCNKQYSFYATRRDLNAFHLSWKTELGEIKNIEIVSYKSENNVEIPYLKADWKAINDGGTAELNIMPILEHKQAPEYSGTIQYALFTPYWKIIGFRKIDEVTFYEILHEMGEIKGLFVDNLKIVTPQNSNVKNNAEKVDYEDSEANYTINDPDGYTNVREEQSSESEVLFTLKEGERFSVSAKEGNWWAITHNGRKGFVHKSRIVKAD